MVLELKAPHASEFEAVFPLWPVFLSYLLSFIYLGIYWNNHHHLFQTVTTVNGGVLWANLHLLFWLSLIPFTTAWMGASGFSSAAVAAYGTVLLLAAASYKVLAFTLIRHHGRESIVGIAVGRDQKGNRSIALYVVGIACSFLDFRIALGMYAAVALLWFVPDRRMEQALEEPR